MITSCGLERKMRVNKRKVQICLTPVALIVLLAIVANCLLYPRMITRFCYNSPDPGRVNSQCVYCSYFHFDATILGCTGSSAVSVNMTSTQAFCVITQCLGQIRQMPIFLGRKRREVDTSDGVVRDEGLDHFSEAPRSLTTEAYAEDSDDVKIASTTETISFTLDGRPEKYIVARHVDVDINYEEPEEDLADLSPESVNEQNHIQEKRDESEI